MIITSFKFHFTSSLNSFCFMFQSCCSHAGAHGHKLQPKLERNIPQKISRNILLGAMHTKKFTNDNDHKYLSMTSLHFGNVFSNHGCTLSVSG